MSGARNWLIIVGILLLGGVAAYFVGGAMARSHAKEQAAAASAQLQAAQAQAATLKSVNRLLTANIWVVRATAALDDRNFGTANEAVSKARASLDTVDPVAAHLDATALAALKTKAAAVQIPVATNLEPQRAQLLALEADIGALVARAEAAIPR